MDKYIPIFFLMILFQSNNAIMLLGETGLMGGETLYLAQSAMTAHCIEFHYNWCGWQSMTQLWVNNVLPNLPHREW